MIDGFAVCFPFFLRMESFSLPSTSGVEESKGVVAMGLVVPPVGLNNVDEEEDDGDVRGIWDSMSTTL